MRLVPLFALLPLSLAAAAGCNGSGPTASSGAPPAPLPGPAAVVFQGGATAPALAHLLAAKLVSDPASAASFDAPANDSELKFAAGPPTFRWHPGKGGHAAAHLPARPGPPALLPPPASLAFLGPLREILGGERAAFADETPMQGPGAYLVFSTDTDPSVLRVFTTGTSYLPDAGAWKSLAVGIWVTARLTTATFASDALVAGEGPFLGGEIKFCVMPPGSTGT